MGPDPELFNQENFVPARVVAEKAGRMAAFEDLPFDLAAPAALMQLMAQEIGVDAEIALEDGLLFSDFDPWGLFPRACAASALRETDAARFGHLQEKRRHQVRRFLPRIQTVGQTGQCQHRRVGKESF